jgi:hypothetical protein
MWSRARADEQFAAWTHLCPNCSLRELPGLVWIEILLRHVIFQNFMRVDLARSSAPRIFDAGYYARLKRISFLKQLVRTLGIRDFDIGQTLQISRLPGRTRCCFLR